MPGDTLVGLAQLTQWDVVAHWSRAAPHRAALVDVENGVTLTFGELSAETERMAGVLAEMGLGPGDRIGLWCDNHWGAAVLLYAAARIGAVWAPVNARFTPDEACRQAHLSRIKALVVDAAHEPLWGQVAGSAPSVLCLRLEGLVEAAARQVPLDPPPASALAGLLYTSGTTGSPKGALHSHQTLLGWGLSMVLAAGWSPGDRLLLPYPLFHMGGAGFLVAAHLTGATVHLLRRADPLSLADAVPRFRITALVAVPTVLAGLFRAHPDPGPALKWPTLKKLATTSGPLFSETRRAIREVWPNAALSTLYSATEAFFSALSPEDQNRAPDSVGRPVFGADIRIVPAEGDPPDGDGVIYTRGSSVFIGYDGQRPLAGRDWFTCQDVGHFDREGFLHITDRLKDLINSGGEKIASREVERVLAEHPAVHEAAVIGVPDPLWGERVHAVVSLRPEASVDVEELRLWCRGRLAGFKVPKSIAVVDDIPKTATGKIAKEVIRRQYRPENPDPGQNGTMPVA